MHADTIDTTILDRYVAAWNEADRERRRAAVGGVYAEHACVVTPSLRVEGTEAILEHISQVFDDFIGSSQGRFRRTAATGHHQSHLLRWELATPGGSVAGSGLIVLLLGPDGRVEADHQFQEPE
jgi:ketosteroid isomerase-like protein